MKSPREPLRLVRTAELLDQDTDGSFGGLAISDELLLEGVSDLCSRNSDMPCEVHRYGSE